EIRLGFLRALREAAVAVLVLEQRAAPSGVGEEDARRVELRRRIHRGLGARLAVGEAELAVIQQAVAAAVLLDEVVGEAGLREPVPAPAHAELREAVVARGAREEQPVPQIQIDLPE